jgi:hypothetical protein
MADRNKFTIEQDQYDDETFHLTFPEKLIDQGIFDIRFDGSVGREMMSEIEKWQQIVLEAIQRFGFEMAEATPGGKWIRELGGEVETKSMVYLADDDDGINDHARGGMTVKFKDRAKAALFKMSFVGQTHELSNAK